jgi:hypothetical protein
MTWFQVGDKTKGCVTSGLRQQAGYVALSVKGGKIGLGLPCANPFDRDA